MFLSHRYSLFAFLLFSLSSTSRSATNTSFAHCTHARTHACTQLSWFNFIHIDDIIHLILYFTRIDEILLEHLNSFCTWNAKKLEEWEEFFYSILIIQRCFLIRSLQTIEFWNRWFLMIWASSSTIQWKWTRWKISWFFSYIFVHHSRLRSRQAWRRANCMFRSNCNIMYIEFWSCNEWDSESFSNKMHSSRSQFAHVKTNYRKFFEIYLK